MRTLRARIALTLVAFGLATLIAVGGALFVVLRDLYQSQATAQLAGIAVPYVAQAQRFGRDRGGGLEGLIADLRELASDATALDIYVASDAGTAVELGTGTQATLPMELPDQAGEILRGIVTIPGTGSMAYAAAAVFGERLPAGIRSLVFMRPDDAA